MKKIFPHINYKIFFAFAAIYIIWGTTYLAIKIGLQSLPPFVMASMRYSIAGVLLLLFCIIKGEVIFSKTALSNILLGAFMLTLGQGVLFWAEKYISSGLTAVFISTLPIMYIITDKKEWKNYFHSKLTMLSIGLGIIGIIILFRGQSGSSEQHTNFMTIIACSVTILSCFCWAIASLYYKYHFKTDSLFANVGWQLIGGTITCLIVSFATAEWGEFTFHTITTNSWLAVLYLAIAGSIVAFIASYYLLARRPAPVVGTYAYVNPVIAVILGYFIAGEIISLSQIIGMVIILVAAYLANTVKFTGTKS